MWPLDPTIVYANTLPFVSLLFFLVFVYNNPVFDKRQSFFFMLTGGVTLLMIVVISLDFTFVNSANLSKIFDSIYIYRRITTFLNFAVSPIVPMLIYNIYAQRKAKFSYYMPGILNGIICFISIFNGCVFHVSTNNAYARGPLFIVPFCVSVLYLFLLIIQSGHVYTKSKRSERLFLLFVVGVLCFCMYLEVVHRFVFLTWDFTSLCIILYYLLLNIHRAIIDPLTGAYNRLAYVKELSRIEGNTSCVIALLDINDFKSINDTLGHDIGDSYLQNFTIVLEQAFSSTSIVYRIGGDEFVIIYKKPSDQQFQQALHQARELAHEKNILFACGWMRYSPKQAMDIVQVEIDKLMYEDKQNCKRTTFHIIDSKKTIDKVL